MISERSFAAQNLNDGRGRTEHDLLRVAVEVGGIGVFETDLVRGWTSFSPELCKMLGLPEGAEMPYAQACLFFHEDDRDAVRREVEAADNPRDLGRWSGVHRVVRRDGIIRWVSMHGRRELQLTALGRRPVRSIGTVVDITHLKETEDSLRRSELRLRLALEAAEMGTFEADSEGSVATIDTQLARLLALPGDTRVVSESECRWRVPNEDLHESDEKKRRLVQNNEPYKHEFRIRMPDGSDRWLSAHAIARNDRLFGVAFDVTHRKCAEIALRESQTRLLLAADAAALGVFEWDVVSDRAVWENDRMYEIFGRTRDQGELNREQFVNRYLHADDVATFETALGDAMKRMGGLHVVCRIGLPDGVQRWLEINGKFEAESGSMRLLGVVADVTVRKDLERRAHELSDRLATLQEEERRRIAQELHDSTVQHLVAASLNLTCVRARSAVSADDERLLGEIEVSIDCALRELRTFSYLMHPPVLRDRNLIAAVREYALGFASRANFDLRLRLGAAVNSVPYPAQRALLRIMQEALANVHRHASATRVSVAIRRIRGHVHLIVTDNGRGLDQAPAKPGPRVPLGVGIRGIEFRVDQLGGDVRLRTSTSGTCLHAAIPLGAEQRKRRSGIARSPRVRL